MYGTVAHLKQDDSMTGSTLYSGTSKRHVGSDTNSGALVLCREVVLFENSIMYGSDRMNV